MHTHARLTIALCLASLLLGLASSPAMSLRSLEINPTAAENIGRIFITYNDMMRSIRMSCELFLDLEYERALSKAAAGNLAEPIGAITEARAANCREGLNNWEVTFLVPSGGFPMRYNGFLGELPRISGILITALEVAVRIRRNAANCLFRGNLPFLVFQEGGGTRFDRKRFLSNRLLFMEGMECPVMSGIEFSGLLPIGPAIEVRLI